ncbi:MAG: anhydro-N-acetylmuramic acid kinase [Bacteroidetes bacterium]|nr:MAG: anhydro-N-acetylmuramic acid kinase [Bacteroidota bacterium]
MQKLAIIGLMSGSSLDGVDLAWCDFEFDPTQQDKPLVSWQLRKGVTWPYPEEWQARLRAAPTLSGRELWLLHTELGHYFGLQVARFLDEIGERPDIVASHGHTVFHFPQKKTTTQLGDGAAMAAVLELPVIDQFRSLDMALGGQGAPLAPLADQYFFGDYFASLNLGGIVNMSVRSPRGYLAFDVTGVNQVLDALVAEIGLPYDDDGHLARCGQLLPDMLAKANALDFLKQPYPKSLGNDWVREQLLPIFQDGGYRLANRLHTLCVHVAQQIGWHLQRVIEGEGLEVAPDAKLLVAGGGGFNGFLCELIAEQVAPIELVKADPDMLAYKEAALMALAGGLRWLHLPNVLPSVTGARRAAVGGAVHWGKDLT